MKKKNVSHLLWNNPEHRAQYAAIGLTKNITDQ